MVSYREKKTLLRPIRYSQKVNALYTVVSSIYKADSSNPHTTKKERARRTGYNSTDELRERKKAERADAGKEKRRSCCAAVIVLTAVLACL